LVNSKFSKIGLKKNFVIEPHAVQNWLKPDYDETENGAIADIWL
jgi:hypothetical protein